MSKMHLVFGGRVKDPRTLDFEDLSKVEVVGFYPDYGSAEKAVHSVGGLFENLFRKKVSGAQGLSSSIVAPGPPKPDRPALPGVPGAERPSGAP